MLVFANVFCQPELLWRLKTFITIPDWIHVTSLNTYLKNYTAPLLVNVPFTLNFDAERLLMLKHYILQHRWNLSYMSRVICMEECSLFRLQPVADVQHKEHPYRGALNKCALAYPHMWMGDGNNEQFFRVPPMDSFIQRCDQMYHWYSENRYGSMKRPLVFATNGSRNKSNSRKHVVSHGEILTRMHSIEWSAFTTEYMELPLQYFVFDETPPNPAVETATQVTQPGKIVCDAPVLVIKQEPRVILVCCKNKVKQCSATVEYMRSSAELACFLRDVLVDEDANWKNGILMVMGSVMTTLNVHLMCPAYNATGFRQIKFSQPVTKYLKVLVMDLLTQRCKLMRAVDICNELVQTAQTDAARGDVNVGNARYPEYHPHMRTLVRHVAYLQDTLAHRVFV